MDILFMETNKITFIKNNIENVLISIICFLAIVIGLVFKIDKVFIVLYAIICILHLIVLRKRWKNDKSNI